MKNEIKENEKKIVMVYLEIECEMYFILILWKILKYIYSSVLKFFDVIKMLGERVKLFS